MEENRNCFLLSLVEEVKKSMEGSFARGCIVMNYRHVYPHVFCKLLGTDIDRQKQVDSTRNSHAISILLSNIMVFHYFGNSSRLCTVPEMQSTWDS